MGNVLPCQRAFSQRFIGRGAQQTSPVVFRQHSKEPFQTGDRILVLAGREVGVASKQEDRVITWTGLIGAIEGKMSLADQTRKCQANAKPCMKLGIIRIKVDSPLQRIEADPSVSEIGFG